MDFCTSPHAKLSRLGTTHNPLFFCERLVWDRLLTFRRVSTTPRDLFRNLDTVQNIQVSAPPRKPSAAAVGRGPFGSPLQQPSAAAAAAACPSARPLPSHSSTPSRCRRSSCSPPAGPQPDPCAPSLQAPSARPVRRSVTLEALWQSSGRTGQMAANGFSRRIANPRVAPKSQASARTRTLT